MVPTDSLMIIVFALAIACWRLRRRWGRTPLGLILPITLPPLIVLTGYCLWYLHRSQPDAVQTEISPGVTYQCVPMRSPRPIVMHIVEFDLTRPGLEFFVTPPEPTGRFDLPARTTTQFAREFECRIAINASYFYPFRANSPYDYYPRSGKGVNAVGSCASNGRWYSSPADGYSLFSISKDNHAAIGTPKFIVWNAVSGQPVLLREGEIEPNLDAEELNPRTAIALDREGRRMWWIIVDGRQPRFSEGMTLRELAEHCRSLGAWTALALDGGGSTTLVIRDAAGTPRVMNSPIHGRHPPGVERPVANHIGLR